MSNISIRLTSDLSMLDRGLRNLSPFVNKTMGESAESIANRIHKGWSGSSPSNPGEPPAVVTGNLDGSVTTDNTGRNTLGQFAKADSASMWYIRIEAEYANALEYGDPSKNLDARPFVAPAVAAEQEEIGDKFAIGFRGIWK